MDDFRELSRAVLLRFTAIWRFRKCFQGLGTPSLLLSRGCATLVLGRRERCFSSQAVVGYSPRGALAEPHEQEQCV